MTAVSVETRWSLQAGKSTTHTIVKYICYLGNCYHDYTWYESHYAMGPQRELYLVFLLLKITVGLVGNKQT